MRAINYVSGRNLNSFNVNEHSVKLFDSKLCYIYDFQVCKNEDIDNPTFNLATFEDRKNIKFKFLVKCPIVLSKEVFFQLLK